MVVYTLRDKGSINELHLFEGQMREDSTCTAGPKSVCQKVGYAEGRTNLFSCLADGAARLKCAAIGRPVCGTCVSHLYASFE